MKILIKELVKPVYYFFRIRIFDFKWRRRNLHNATRACSLFPEECVKIGNFTYGNLDVRYYRTEKEHLEIGSLCSIGSNVRFLLGGEHDYSNVTTFPVRHNILGGKWESVSKGPILISDDVWIGSDVVILSGVTIGQGAVIGAGSVVAGDVPPYAVFCSGRILRFRFSEEDCRKMLKFDFSRLTKEEMVQNAELFYDIGLFLQSEFYRKHLKPVSELSV